MAPMGTNYSTTDGLSTERDKLYYAERARGGVGMIMTEAMVVTEHARPHHNSLCCYHDRFIPGLASLVDAIKAHATPIIDTREGDARLLNGPKLDGDVGHASQDDIDAMFD